MAKSGRIAVIWANFGMYHLARISALQQTCDLVAIELAGFQKRSGWKVRSGNVKNHVRLAEGTLEEQVSWRLAGRLVKVLEAVSPDLVLVHGYGDASALAAACWARFRGRPAVLMSESTFIDKSRNVWVERCKSVLLPALYSRVLVGGRRSFQYALRLGFRPDQIFCGYNVVGNDFYSAGVAELRARSKPDAYGLSGHYFLFVGRLAPEKNLAFLLRCFGQYRSNGGDWDLVLVGAGPLESSLKEQVAGSPYASFVHFAGFKNGAELLPYYAFAGCFVLPSIKEPWGLVVNEAMASGLPVLVSNRCGSGEDLVERGGNGFIFDPESEPELAELMQRISSAPGSERARLGARSAEVIQRFSPERFASAVRGIAESCGASGHDSRADGGRSGPDTTASPRACLAGDGAGEAETRPTQQP